MKKAILFLLVASFVIGGFCIGSSSDAPPQPSNSSSSCECGTKAENIPGKIETRIVKGYNADISDYPYIVALIGLIDYTYECGGMVISTYHILTAAQCLKGFSPFNMSILAGDTNIEYEITSPYAMLIPILTFSIHPDYDSTTLQNDLAIVTTAQIISFNPAIRPICLPINYKDENFVGETVTTLGYGWVYYGGPLAWRLKGIEQTVIECDAEIGKKPVSSNIQICTNGTDDKTTCDYDLGGPNIWKDPNGRWQLIGLQSYSNSHCDNPDVSARVTAYLDWIKSELTVTGPIKVDICVK